MRLTPLPFQSFATHLLSQNIPTYICTVRPTYFSTYAYFLPQLFYKKIATDRKKEKSFDSRYIFVVLKSF